jgi:hypothetical protein
LAWDAAAVGAKREALFVTGPHQRHQLRGRDPLFAGCQSRKNVVDRGLSVRLAGEAEVLRALPQHQTQQLADGEVGDTHRQTVKASRVAESSAGLPLLLQVRRVMGTWTLARGHFFYALCESLCHLISWIHLERGRRRVPRIVDASRKQKGEGQVRAETRILWTV